MSAGGYFHPKYGMVSNRPYVDDGPGCDNLFLFTARYFMRLIELRDQPTETESNAFYAFLGECVITPGNFRRYPGRVDINLSQDEIVGIICASYVLGNLYPAKSILAYAIKHLWSWNLDESISWKGWLGRHFWLPPFVTVAAGERLGFFWQIVWAGYAIITAIPEKQNTSGKLIFIDMIPIMKDRYTIIDIGISLFTWIMKRKYPGGKREVSNVYFGPNYPLTVYEGPENAWN